METKTTQENSEACAGLAAAGSVYRFSTFQELVDRVPGDRIRECMEELGTVLGTAKLTAELVEGVARNLAEADGKTVPPPNELNAANA